MPLQPCTLLLPHPAPLCLGLCFPGKGQVDETWPVALIHGQRRKLAPFRDDHWGSAGCFWASWGLQPWFEAEPRAVPGASPAGRLGCLPQHARGLFLSYRLLEPAGSCAEQASHRHPGLVPQWESGQHVAASTCAHQPTWALPGKPSPQPRSHLPYPCARDVDFLTDIFLCSTGASGAQGRALGALNPTGHQDKAKAWWMHRSQILSSLRF